MQRIHRWIAATAVLAAASAECASAQTARSGAGASAQLYEQMQQLASERTALQAENEKLKGQLADLRKDRDALKAGQQSVERRAQGAAVALAQSTSQCEATERELAQYKAKMEELIDKFRETIGKLREAESNGATAKQSLAARERELQGCVDHNLALYRLNGEVLAHFDRQGFWSGLARAEPFTQIKRVQNENLIEEYRSRAQDQRAPGAKPNAPEASSTPTTSPAAAASPDRGTR
jgi:DNA repair exonuclease SbcCD ATPase subunit